MEDYVLFLLFVGLPFVGIYAVVRVCVKLLYKGATQQTSRKVGATSNTQIHAESDAQTVAGTWFDVAVKPEDYDLPTFLRKARAAVETA